MLAAVERLPGRRVGEPEVGAAVDDHGVVGQLLGDRRGLAVRQAEEDHVVAGEHLERGLARAPGRPAAPGAAGGAPSALPALEPAVRAPISTSGCAEQQPEQLAAGVPARPGDRDRPFRHVHDYTDAMHVTARLGQVRWTAPVDPRCFGDRGIARRRRSPPRSGCGRAPGTAARRPATSCRHRSARRCRRRTAGPTRAGHRPRRAARRRRPPPARRRRRPARRPPWRPGRSRSVGALGEVGSVRSSASRSTSAAAVRGGTPYAAHTCGCSSPAWPTTSPPTRIWAQRPGCHGASEPVATSTSTPSTCERPRGPRCDGVGPRGRAAAAPPAGAVPLARQHHAEVQRLVRARRPSARRGRRWSGRRSTPRIGRRAAGRLRQEDGGRLEDAERSVLPRPTLRAAVSSRPGSRVVASIGLARRTAGWRSGP